MNRAPSSRRALSVIVCVLGPAWVASAFGPPVALVGAAALGALATASCALEGAEGALGSDGADGSGGASTTTPMAGDATSCDDGLRDGDETDVDCGGSCPACGNGLDCATAVDCQSTACVEGRCCSLESYERSTGLQSGQATLCCDGDDVLLDFLDCGEGQNHGVEVAGPNCVSAFEGEANGGSSCAQIQCQTKRCIATEPPGGGEQDGSGGQAPTDPGGDEPAEPAPPAGDGSPGGCGSAGAVSCQQNEYGVTFSNNDGQWVIYTGCFGPAKRGGGDVTVGPGYVARVVLAKPTPDGQTTLVDDERGPGSVNGVLNAPGYGGLGAFGWHHARGYSPFTLGPNEAWNIDGRHCAEDNGGFGVVGAEVIDGPYVTADSVGVLAIDVSFADGWTGAGNPLMRVRYRYRVKADVVKMWAVATQHCPDGACGGAPPAFIKEPKFVAAVNGGGYSRVSVLNHEGALASNSVSGTPYCAWMGTNPVVSTGQCDANYRARARFDYGTATDEVNGNCDTTSRSCLNVVMRAYPVTGSDDVTVGQQASAWEGSGLGLDAWAVAASSRQAVAGADSPAGNATWSCHGGDPGAARMRRWELIGGPKSNGQYQSASVYFPAWEGGTGAYDCEPLSRRFGPDGESFAVHAQYSINAGFEL